MQNTTIETNARDGRCYRCAVSVRSAQQRRHRLGCAQLSCQRQRVGDVLTVVGSTLAAGMPTQRLAG